MLDFVLPIAFVVRHTHIEFRTCLYVSELRYNIYGEIIIFHTSLKVTAELDMWGEVGKILRSLKLSIARINILDGGKKFTLTP